MTKAKERGLMTPQTDQLLKTIHSSRCRKQEPQKKGFTFVDNKTVVFGLASPRFKSCAEKNSLLKSASAVQCASHLDKIGWNDDFEALPRVPHKSSKKLDCKSPIFRNGQPKMRPAVFNSDDAPNQEEASDSNFFQNFYASARTKLT